MMRPPYRMMSASGGAAWPNDSMATTAAAMRTDMGGIIEATPLVVAEVFDERHRPGDSRMRVVTTLIWIGLTFLVPALAEGQSGPRNCTRTSQNLYVRDVLDDYYLWYRELPRLNPSNYASPEAYLEAARFRPLDDSFSYITSQAQN